MEGEEKVIQGKKDGQKSLWVGGKKGEQIL